jgi:hypothetical protein
MEKEDVEDDEDCNSEDDEDYNPDDDDKSDGNEADDASSSSKNESEADTVPYVASPPLKRQITPTSVEYVAIEDYDDNDGFFFRKGDTLICWLNYGEKMFLGYVATPGMKYIPKKLRILTLLTIKIKLLEPFLYVILIMSKMQLIIV